MGVTNFCSAGWESREARFRSGSEAARWIGRRSFTMRNRFLGSVLAVVAVLASSPGTLAQQPGAAKAPPSATPDLSGVWMVGRGYRGFNRKEPPPMQPWAEEIYKVTREGISDPDDKGRDDKDPIINCAPPGPTRLFALPRPFEIIPIPGRVLLLFEWDHWVRQIYT